MGNELSQEGLGGTEHSAFQSLEESTEKKEESADNTETAKEFITGLQGIVDNIFSLVSKPDDQEQCAELQELRNTETSQSIQHLQAKPTAAENPRGILSPDFQEKLGGLFSNVLSHHLINKDSENVEPTKTEQEESQAKSTDDPDPVDNEVSNVLISEDFQVIFGTLLQNITAGIVSKEFSEWSDTPRENGTLSSEDTSSRNKPWASMNNAVVYEKELTEAVNNVLGMNNSNEFAEASTSSGKDACLSSSDDQLTREGEKSVNLEKTSTSNSDPEVTANPFVDLISSLCSSLTHVDNQLTGSVQEPKEPDTISPNCNHSESANKDNPLVDILSSVLSNLTFDKESEHPDVEIESITDNTWAETDSTDLVEEFKLNAAQCLSDIFKDIYVEPWRPHVQKFLKDKGILERAAELRSTNLPIDRKLHEIHRALQARGNKKVHPRDTLRINKLKRVRDVQMASSIFQDIQQEERDAQKYGVDSFSWDEETIYDEQDEMELRAETPNTTEVYVSSGVTTKGVMLGDTHITPDSKSARNEKPQTSAAATPQDTSVELKASGSIKAVVIGNTTIEAESDDSIQIGCSVTTLKGIPEEMRTLK